MSQGWRTLAAGCLGVHLACLAGCETSRTAALPSAQELAADLSLVESPRLARLQRAEPPAAPASPPTKLPPLPVPPPPPGVSQTSLTTPRPNRIRVRAWVNGRPIFDDEVMQNLSPRLLQELARLSESQRNEKMTEVFNAALDQIIEQEVIYQEAVRKLEKVNPRTLDKLKSLASQDFEKQIERIAKNPGVSPEELKEFQRQMRHQAERTFISMEYMRSRIFPLLNAIGFQEIKDYYDSHPNEFQKVEAVKWQDVFLAVGPKYPTLADARRVAEDLIAQCRTSEDFARLVQFDDGDSKFRNGEGSGSRRGEIRPPELEEHLFKLRDGEIGPIVALSTGVHIFRLVSRDPGGPISLNEDTQNRIRGKLRNQLADREYKRIARELRSRAVIELERDAG